MRVRAAVILMASLVALSAAACARHEPQRAAASLTAPARDVATAEVVRAGETGEVPVPATVRARRRAALSARAPASVIELPYEEGQRVRAGAVVVRLDDGALRAAAAAADAAVKAAEADLARTKALLEKGAATPRELEQVTAAASGASAQLTAARDSLSYTALRAPFAGRVAARRVNLGDVVNPGVPLIEIEGEGGLELTATVESALAATLRPGARLRAQVDGVEEPLPAIVTAMAPSGDSTTHRFELKADLPAAADLRAGLFARLLVPAEGGSARLLVPAEAVFERGGLTGLFVVDGGKARLRWIAAGSRDGDTLEARAGVEAGERVVLQPAGLVDGTPVNERRQAVAPRPGSTQAAAATRPSAREAR
jgi:RND family efflux transporter MFP subunit